MPVAPCSSGCFRRHRRRLLPVALLRAFGRSAAVKQRSKPDPAARGSGSCFRSSAFHRRIRSDPRSSFPWHPRALAIICDRRRRADWRRDFAVHCGEFERDRKELERRGTDALATMSLCAAGPMRACATPSTSAYCCSLLSYGGCVRPLAAAGRRRAALPRRHRDTDAHRGSPARATVRRSLSRLCGIPDLGPAAAGFRPQAASPVLSFAA